MAPRDVSNCVSHCQHGEPEGERNTEQADADLGEGRGNDSGAATAQGQPECADQVASIFNALAPHHDVGFTDDKISGDFVPACNREKAASSNACWHVAASCRRRADPSWRKVLPGDGQPVVE
jgi:hypothetical protein